MISSINNNALYVGVTNDLKRRLYEHKNGLIDGFTKKYHCQKLVWYESTADIYQAITKEKQIKKWKREYKNNVINEKNPEWKDLVEEIF